MTYPFSNGDVLQASDMNAVGLHLITPTSVTGGTLDGATVNITNGATSLTVSGVFSSNFDNYRLLVHVGPTSAITGISMQFGTTTGNVYYGSYAYALHSDTSTTNSPQSGVNSLYITDGDTYAYAESLADVTIFSPYIAQRTTIMGNHYGRGFSGWQAGQVATSDQYTSFVLFPASGNFASGGTIRVYGYSNG